MILCVWVYGDWNGSEENVDPQLRAVGDDGYPHLDPRVPAHSPRPLSGHPDGVRTVASAVGHNRRHPSPLSSPILHPDRPALGPFWIEENDPRKLLRRCHRQLRGESNR